MRRQANLTTTTIEQFRELAVDHRVVPVTRRVLADGETPLSAYAKLAGDRPGTFLLESAENGRSWSRWSFIGAGSPAALTVVDGEASWWGTTPAGAPVGGDPLEALAASLHLLATDPLPDMPPLTGGFVGFMAYDMVRRLERLPETTVDDLGLPDLFLLLATDLAAVDHHEGTITLIANAVNWDGSDEHVDEAYADAVTRLDQCGKHCGKLGVVGLLTPFWAPAIMVRAAVNNRRARRLTSAFPQQVRAIAAGNLPTEPANRVAELDANNQTPLKTAAITQQPFI